MRTLRHDIEHAHAHHNAKASKRQQEADELHRVAKLFAAGRLHTRGMRVKRMRPADADTLNSLNKKLGGRDDG